MSLLPFCQWLAETPGSIALRESLYMYPLVESAHVLTLTGEGRTPPMVLKLVGIVSLLLWFGVGAGGRWIGFSG